MEVDKSYLTSASVMYDALFCVGGRKAVDTLLQQGDAIHFVNESFRHCKPIGAVAEGIELLAGSDVAGVDVAAVDGGTNVVVDSGVVTLHDASDMTQFNEQFAQAIAQHRHWDRELKEEVPA